MSIFEPAPIKVLTKEETLAAIKRNQPDIDFASDSDLAKYRVNSPWLCDLLDEFEKGGYVYNAWAQHKIEEMEGLPVYNENNSTIALLIYNAQRYRLSDKIIAMGFAPLTREMIEEAIKLKKKIEIYSESLIGDTIRGGYRPCIVGDSAYVLAPRAKVRGFKADGTKAARIVFE